MDEDTTKQPKGEGKGLHRCSSDGRAVQLMRERGVGRMIKAGGVGIKGRAMSMSDVGRTYACYFIDKDND